MTRKKSGDLARWYTLPGLGISLLPAGICPVCWPIYAGILSSLGLGFLLKRAYLLLLTVLFLLVALIALAYKAYTKNLYGPLALGFMASVLIIIGKFFWTRPFLTYGGTSLLFIASVWNAWPSENFSKCLFLKNNKRRSKMKTKRLIEVFSAGCPLCQETVKLVQQLAYPSYEVKVIGLNDPQGLKRAQELGVKTVPAVAIDGQLAACCQNRGPREKTLRLAGLGYPLKEGNQEDPQ